MLSKEGLARVTPHWTSLNYTYHRTIYRTAYRTAYRHSPGLTPSRPRYACCPGWKRTNGLPGACGAGEGQCALCLI